MNRAIADVFGELSCPMDDCMNEDKPRRFCMGSIFAVEGDGGVGVISSSMALLSVNLLVMEGGLFASRVEFATSALVVSTAAILCPVSDMALTSETGSVVTAASACERYSLLVSCVMSTCSSGYFQGTQSFVLGFIWISFLTHETDR